MSEEIRISISHLGIYPSNETLLKRSKSLTGIKRKPISEITRLKMSRAHLGHKLTEETRAKMRKCKLNENAFGVKLESFLGPTVLRKSAKCVCW
jgi:hypothetical protein